MASQCASQWLKRFEYVIYVLLEDLTQIRRCFYTIPRMCNFQRSYRMAKSIIKIKSDVNISKIIVNRVHRICRDRICLVPLSYHVVSLREHLVYGPTTSRSLFHDVSTRKELLSPPSLRSSVKVSHTFFFRLSLVVHL